MSKITKVRALNAIVMPCNGMILSAVTFAVMYAVYHFAWPSACFPVF